MKQDWENITVTYDNSVYALPGLIKLWMNEPSPTAYENVKVIQDYLVLHEFEVPKVVKDYLENSNLKNLKPGQKRSSSAKSLRDMGIYLQRNYSDINHGHKQQYYGDQADEHGLLDEKHLAERCNQVKKLFAQHEPGYIRVEYKFLTQEANEKGLSGRKASRYAEDIIAKKCHLSKAEVRRIVNNT